MNWNTLIERYDSLDSTMLMARKRINDRAPQGVTVVAAEQTQGRGRHGRAWFAGKDIGLWMSSIVYPPQGRNAHELSLIAGIALRAAVIGKYNESPASSTHAEDVRLKWPNDLLVGEKKLAGILLYHEIIADKRSAVIIGIGLNCRATTKTEVPHALQEIYIGVEDIITGTCTPDALLTPVVENLEKYYRHWCEEGLASVLPLWKKADALRGRKVRADAERGVVEGIADGIGEDGSLIIVTDTGRVAISSGEVEKVQTDLTT